MTKRRTILAVVLGLIMALCLSLAVACGGTEAESEVIKWTINDKEHVTVTVNDSEELPETYTVGETLTFKVVPASGYEATVKNGRTTLKGTDNVYSIEVKSGKSANDIAITVSRVVESVAITKNPDRLTYYAGEKLDETGMEVSVTYATKETEKLEKGYVVNYSSEEDGCFVLGDTSFTVSYGKFTTDPVQLTGAVEVKITINPVGGVIEADILEAWKARTDIKGYAVDADGIISFTYSKLESPITLPTNEEILLDGGTESSLNGWIDQDNNGYTEIGTDNKLSRELHANWNLVLVNLKKMELVLEGGKPYLALTMSINTDFSAYAYFLEGSQHIEVKGDEIQGKAGETVTAKIDLTKLQETTSTENGKPFDARGAWMDIRVNTTINGIDVTQSFSYDPANPFIEYGQMIHDDEYCYRFTHYLSGGKLDLKVYYYDYLTTYYMDLQEVDSKPTLVMNGQVNTKRQAAQDFPFENAKIDITFGSAVVSGTAKADGSWEASLDLTTVGKGFNATATSCIMTSADNSKTLDLSKNGKLDLTGCGTIFDYNPSASNPRYFQNTKNIQGVQCTVGCDWNEPFLTVKDVDNTINEIVGDVALRYDNAEAPTKVYYVVTVKVGKNLASEATLKSNVTFGDGGDVMNPAEVNSLGNNVYELLFDITDREASGSKLYVHLYLENEVWNGSDGNILDSDSSENGKYLTLGEKKYSIANEYSMPNLVVESYDPTAKSASFENLALKVDNFESPTKVYYVVTVKVENFTFDEVKKLVLGNIDASSRDLYEQDATKAKCVDEGNHLYEIWFDVTECTGDHLYMKLFFMESGTKDDLTNDNLVVELKEPSFVYDGLYAVVGGKKYSIVNKSGDPYWNFASLVVTEAAETDKNPAYTNPDYVPVEYGLTIDYTQCKLELKEGKPVLTVKGKVQGYTSADKITFDVQVDDKWNYIIPATQSATIDASGNFTLTVDLSDISTNTAKYLMHLQVNAQITDNSYGGDPKYTANGKAYDVDLSDEAIAALGKADGDTLFTQTADGKVYSIVIYGKWNRHMVVLTVTEAIDEDAPAFEATGADIELATDKVYFIISGTSENYKKADLENALKEVHFDLQSNGYNNNQWNGDWTEHTFDRTVTVEDDGTWTIKFDVTALTIPTDGLPYIGHWLANPNCDKTDDKTDNDNSGLDLKLSAAQAKDGKYVELNGKRYTLVNKEVGDAPVAYGNVSLRVSEAGVDIKEFDKKSADLVEENGKVYLVYKGTYAGYTEEELKAFDWLASLEENPNAGGHATGEGGGWAIKNLEGTLTVNTDAKTWEYKCEVTEVALNHYTVHFSTQGGAKDDFVKPGKDWSTEKVVGDKLYKLVTYATDNNGNHYWNCYGLEISDYAAPTLAINSVTLEADAGNTKAFYVVTITVTNYTKDQLKTALQYGDDGDGKVKVGVDHIADGENGTLKVYFDITAAPANEWIWSRLYVNGEKKDIKTGGSANGLNITVGNKKYAIKNDGSTWDMDVVVVTNA